MQPTPLGNAAIMLRQYDSLWRLGAVSLSRLSSHYRKLTPSIRDTYGLTDRGLCWSLGSLYVTIVGSTMAGITSRPYIMWGWS